MTHWSSGHTSGNFSLDQAATNPEESQKTALTKLIYFILVFNECNISINTRKFFFDRLGMCLTHHTSPPWSSIIAFWQPKFAQRNSSLSVSPELCTKVIPTLKLKLFSL